MKPEYITGDIDISFDELDTEDPDIVMIKTLMKKVILKNWFWTLHKVLLIF